MNTVRRAATQFDVCIVGGGVVGLAHAALLAGDALRVAVVEAAPPGVDAMAAEHDLRVFAITCASARILARAGAWQRVLSQRLGHFRRMQVWDANSSGRIEFDSAQLAEPTLGYIVEQRVLKGALESALQGAANVVMFRPASLESWSTDDEHLAINLGDGRFLTTRLLVGADGSESRVRALAGIAHERRLYDHHAVVCNVRTALAHGDVARQRFLASGPLAFLPLDEADLSSIVWSTSPAEAMRLRALDEGAFAAELAAAFEYTLGDVTHVGARAAYPLSRANAGSYVQPRIALIGDAAHSIHPLAGQGANLGLLDAAALAECVHEAAAHGRDIGSMRVLRRYERWRSGENRLMQQVMDGFKVLFGTRSAPLPWVRGMGLRMVDQAPIAKEWIMRHAMGLAGDLPAVARHSGAPIS
jgi:2-octaprenylphenol hydroxylase